MTRLLRPHIPLEVRCHVALRQLGEMWTEGGLDERRGAPGGLGRFLEELLCELAELLGSEPRDLRLDHDPALGTRRKIFRRDEHVEYDPPACSVEHLVYRTHADHLRKTNLRGDGAQFPDRVRIKRNRRIEARGAPKSILGPKKRKINRGRPRWPRRPLRGRKKAWPKRPLRA